MANFTIPGTWSFDGSVGNTQVTYVVDGHTVTENYQVLFDRKVPQSQNGSYTPASYRIRIRRTDLDANGDPVEGVAVADLTIRWPYLFEAAKVKAMIGLMQTTLADANIQADIVDLQRLPR